MAKLKIKNIFFGLLRGVFYLICLLLFIFVSLLLIINLPSVKEKIAQEGLNFVNTQFKTQIAAKVVRVDFFGNLIFSDVSAKDHHNYEFLKVEEAKGYTNTISLLENILINKKIYIELDQIRLKNPIARVITYKGEHQDNFLAFIAKFKPTGPKSDASVLFKTRADIINGQLSIVNQNLPLDEQVWLDASEVNIKVPDVTVLDSNVRVAIEQFNFKAKRHKENYVVKQVSGEFLYSHTEMAFKNLTLESDTSLLFGSLFFRYTEENGMSDFTNKVNWDLEVKKGSKVSGKDIRYFTKEWKSNAIVDISAKVKGPLNNLTLSNPILSVDKTFYSSSNLILKNVVTPNRNKLFSIQTKNALLQTSYASLKSWLPGFISSKIPEVVSNLGAANYKGEFSIDRNLVAVKGNLISSVGSILTDANLANYTSKIPEYKGWIETTNLNLAPFTKSSIIGPVTSKITFNGKGFNLNQLDTEFDAQLTKLEVNDKEINAISAVGNLKNKLFNGKINADDVHAKFNFQGYVDFSQKIINTKFEADIKSIDLGYFIPVIDKNNLFKGIVKTDIKFSTIDDLIGEINVNDIVLTKESGEVKSYNDIQIKTTSEEGNRNLDIFSPNMITTNIYGKYKLNDVPAMLQEGIGNLLVNYKPKRRFDNQEFSFILDVQNDLFDLLMLDINISPGTTITGRYMGTGNQLQAQVISQYIYYKNIKLSDPNIFLNTADSLRQFTGSLSSLNIDKTKIDKIDFSGFKRNDSLFASTKFYYGKDKEKQTNFDLNLYQTRIENDLIFGFRPSDINLFQAKWTLNPEFKSDEAIARYNVITNKLTLEKIVAKSEKSEIKISGEYFSKDNYDFNLNLTEVELAKVIPESLLKDMTFEGVANGTAEIVKTPKEFKPLVNLNVKGLVFNKQILGDLLMEAIYNTEEDKYLVNTKLIDSDKEHFSAQGYIKNEKDKPAQLNIELVANQFNVAPIGTFLQGIFSKFRGEASGNVQITGDLTNPEYQGALTLDKVGFTVNFTGVDYQVTKEQDLHISNGVFLFDNIELIDTEAKTTGTVFGVLITKNFVEWGLNLDFATDKLLVLNTTPKENDLFYGSVYASGTFSINGDTGAKGIEISAKARVLEGSKLTINSSSTTNATDISYIKFLPEKPLEDGEEPIVKAPMGLSINADVTADSKSVVDLIINQETGDKIEVRGDAKNLKFNMSKAGRITMDGTYTITGDSKYHYNMFVNKDFKIQSGSTIIWDGRGPTEANLNITANYIKGVSNIGDYLGTSTIPTTNVIVKALLSGYLSKPKIEFDIDVEGASSIKDQLRTKFNNNEGEKLNQVAGIVVFGSFLSDKMGGSSYASSAYDIVLKQLTSVLNNISGVFSLDANFNAGSKVDNTSDRISLDPAFKLNPRLSIVGSVNMPLEQKSAADVWTYGARADYDISKNRDKSLIISGFSKPSTFGLETTLLGSSWANNQSYGGGIVYKRSFNHIREIIGRKNKEKKKESDSITVKTESEK